MTAVPLSIVAMRTPWPGQSTKETWRIKAISLPQWTQTAFSTTIEDRD
jgi:hypothetical protein